MVGAVYVCDVTTGRAILFLPIWTVCFSAEVAVDTRQARRRLEKLSWFPSANGVNKLVLERTDIRRLVQGIGLACPRTSKI
jgi:hypothetical protein